MASDQNDDQAIYIRDILPQNLKDLFNEPDYNIDKALLYQIKEVARCKKDLVSKRTRMLTAISDEYMKHNYGRCGPVDEEFLCSVQKDVEKDEAEARRKVLGEQESVEMFKSALASNLVSEDYLSAARAYRDNKTTQLRNVVESREVLLIALEILRRLPTSQNCPQNPMIERLKAEYTEAKSRHVAELDLLKKLTEWKKNPDMYITDDDEFFTFFNDDFSGGKINEEENYERKENAESEKGNEATSSATLKLDEEKRKLIHFKLTKVESVDGEFRMISDLAYDILKHDQTLQDIMSNFQQESRSYDKSARSSLGIQQYVNYLRRKHPKLKIKVATKGYNFSLKVMRRTKSVMSLALLSTLLETVQEMPEEILQAQENISILSNATKRICGMYGRCSMAFQSLINKEIELDKVVRDVPRVNYAESLRVSGHFAYNIKELKRINELIDKVKRMADSILEDVVRAAGENKIKQKDLRG